MVELEVIGTNLVEECVDSVELGIHHLGFQTRQHHKVCHSDGTVEVEVLPFDHLASMFAEAAFLDVQTNLDTGRVIAQHFLECMLVFDDSLLDLNGFAVRDVTRAIEVVGTSLHIVFLVDNIQTAHVEGFTNAVVERCTRSIDQRNLAGNNLSTSLFGRVVFDDSLFLHGGDKLVASAVDETFQFIGQFLHLLSFVPMVLNLLGIINKSSLETAVGVVKFGSDVLVRLVHGVAHGDETRKDFSRHVECQECSVDQVHHTDHFLSRCLRTVCSTHILSL